MIARRSVAVEGGGGARAPSQLARFLPLGVVLGSGVATALGVAVRRDGEG